MDKIYLFSFKFLKFIVEILPKSSLNSFTKTVGNIAFKLNKKHRNIAKANLDLAYGDELSSIEKLDIIKRTYQNFGRFGADFILNQNSTKEFILSKVSFKNTHFFEKALSLGHPIIIQTAHYGNWELFSLAMSAKYGSLSIIGRSLDSDVMNEILSQNRTQFNIELIDKKNATRSVIRALKDKRLLGILTDQNTTKKDGIEVEFFGRRVLHTPAASVFANKMNAIIIPTFIYQNSSGIDEICFFEPIDIKKFDKENAIKKATQLQANATEKIIKQKPDEYFWFHKRFKHFYEEAYE
ncbi:MAG: lipid A biosynthesis acyltransferase [Campylobacter sp.]|nr:lipid A biosynthesis acyltransferase [Campylobacter sp.]